MCDAVTIGAVAAVASTAFSYQQYQQQGKYQKGVAEYNARVAENEAEKTRELATEEENIQRRRTSELLAKQRAQLGAANIELTSGSALQLQEDTATLGEADALRIRSNYGSRIGALGTEADLTRSQGDFAENIASQKSTGTLLSGAGAVLGSGVADKWFTPKSAATQNATVQPGLISQQPFNPATNLGIS